MKTLFCMALILLLTPQVYAETYSWVDDSGTYNYTEDYSTVPKKYRKKVKRRAEIQQEASPDIDSKSGKTDKKDAKPAAVSVDEKKLYGGKSLDAWRKEMDIQEAELKRIELRMEELRKQVLDTKGVRRAQYDVLKKEYDDNRVEYDQKYKNYTELIETVRKAGINVEIKK